MLIWKSQNHIFILPVRTGSKPIPHYINERFTTEFGQQLVVECFHLCGLARTDLKIANPCIIRFILTLPLYKGCSHRLF